MFIYQCNLWKKRLAVCLCASVCVYVWVGSWGSGCLCSRLAARVWLWHTKDVNIREGHNVSKLNTQQLTCGLFKWIIKITWLVLEKMQSMKDKCEDVKMSDSRLSVSVYTHFPQILGCFALFLRFIFTCTVWANEHGSACTGFFYYYGNFQMECSSSCVINSLTGT